MNYIKIKIVTEKMLMILKQYLLLKNKLRSLKKEINI